MKHSILPLPIMLLLATPSLACEGKDDWAWFAESYETMISGTLENQEKAAAEFLTSLKPRLIDSDDPGLRSALGHATDLTNGIREQNLPNQTQVDLHKKQIRWVKNKLKETTCNHDSPVEGEGKGQFSLIRSVLVITLSLAAILVFVRHLPPRSFSLKRWVGKRIIRREIQAVLKVKTLSDDEAKITRVRGINLTNGGMSLFWPSGAPPTQTRVTIILPEMEKDASLVWSNTFISGVEFDAPLSNEQVVSLANDLHREAAA